MIEGGLYGPYIDIQKGKGKPVTDFHQLFHQYYNLVYSIAYQVTKDASLAEDVLQETFWKAYQKECALKDPLKMKAWLSTIARNTAIDYIRKHKKEILLEEEQVPKLLYMQRDHTSDVEQELEKAWVEETVKGHMKKLSPKLQEVFQLNYYDQLQEKEIAQKLHLSKSAVKSRLHRAKKEIGPATKLSLMV